MSLKLGKSLICLVVVGYSVSPPWARPQNDTSQTRSDAQKLLHENTDLYFPDRAFINPGGSVDKQLGERIAWLGVYLRSIGEPPLPNDSNKSESYRLVYIGFPTGKIVVLRLSISANGTARTFAKQTAYNQTSLLLDQENSASREAVNGFLESVARAKFWELPTVDSSEQRMPDGSYWYLEGARSNQCHIVYRRTPELHPNSFTDIGRYLANDLAHLSDSVLAIPRGDRSEPARRTGHP